MKKLINLISLVLIVVMIFAACGKSNENNADTTQSKLTPVDGGTIKLACFVPDTLNPFATQYQNVRDVLMIVYEGLFKAESTLKATPVLAEGYSVSTSNKIYTIKLKPDILFHDGSAMDADDVIATFEYIKNYSTPHTDMFKNVLTFKKIDQLTVALELISPQADFVNNLDFPILPAGLNRQSFAEENSSFVPVGTGRFMYDDIVQNKYMTYKKNQKWHGDKKTYADDIKISFLHSSKDLFHAFDAGEIDMFTTNGSNWGEFTFTANHKIYETGSPRYTYIGVNTNHPQLSDAELRRDINKFIDKNEMVEEVMFSHAVPADLPIISTAYYITKDTDTKDDKTQAPEGEKAEDVAIKDDTEKRDITLYLLYNSESNIKQRAASYIKRVLEPHGIIIEYQKCDFEEYKARIASGNYELYIGEVVMHNNMNMDFMFNSLQKTEQNLCTYTGDEFDNLMVNLNMRDAMQDNTELFFENFSKHFLETLPQIPLFHTNTALFVNNRIKGSITPDMTAFYNDIGDFFINYK